MTYPTAGGPGPGVYQGQPPWTPPTPPPPQPPRRTATRLALAAAILTAGLGGGIIGSLLTSRTSDTSPTITARETTTPEYIHAQDVKLCTEYVFTNEALPRPRSSGDLVSAAAAVRTSLAAHPDASANIRSALGDVVDSYFAELSHSESRGARGLVEPPQYDQAAAQATYDRAWAVCGLK